MAVFVCQSFGNHNVPLVAVLSFLPAGVLVSNHYVQLVTMLRFLPAGVLVITVCRLGQKFLPAGVLVITMCHSWQCRGFLPAGCGHSQCATCGSFCLPEFW